MKYILFVFLSIYLISGFVSANDTILRPVTPIRVIKPVRIYVPVKSEYKQIRVSKLPMKGNKIDSKKLVLNISSSKKGFFNTFSTIQKRDFNLTVNYLKRNNKARAKMSWQKLVSSFKNQNQPFDLNEILNTLLREAYLDSNKDLHYYSTKLATYNSMKEKIRDSINTLRKLKAGLPSGTVTGNDLDAELEKWDEELQTIGDDAQLANIDLQNALQKQQQTIQMLSSVSKMMHDTAMAIIRKIG